MENTDDKPKRSLAAALLNAQKDFSPAIKNSSNPYFKSKYADLATCVDAVIDALNDNGIMLTQRTYECTTGVKVETIFLHESGEQLGAGMLYMPVAKADSQAFGSALTYARRYSLMTACGIAPEDDDGQQASHGAAKQPQHQRQQVRPRPQQQAQQPPNLDSILKVLDGVENMEQLKEVYSRGMKACAGYAEYQAQLTLVKDALKVKLGGGE